MEIGFEKLKKHSFTGFYPQTIKFLTDLGMNNYKSWFEQHRDNYQKYLLNPMQRLVLSLAPTMLALDKNFEVAPKVDKTISRIYRDIRFSRDKAPLRNNMWITFKRRVQNWQDTPCFYFELMPDSYRFGMGYYQATSRTMKLFRKQVDRSPNTFLKCLEPLTDYFTVEGEDYKKVFPVKHDYPIDKYYNKKTFYLMHKRQLDDLLFSDKLVAKIQKGFNRCSQLYKFLWQLKNREE
jgi:uncharacterized protein (TIGR02453 family)